MESYIRSFYFMIGSKFCRWADPQGARALTGPYLFKGNELVMAVYYSMLTVS